MRDGPIAATLLRLAWPNILTMLAQAGVALIETWMLAHLGAPVLAGVAVVIPVLMLMQHMSQGAIGGGISAAVSRALGAGQREAADALIRHAALLAIAIGLGFTALIVGFGRPLYRAMGVDGEALAAALTYSNVLFAGTALIWLMNALASAVRGTGNMLVPGAVILGGAVLTLPVAAALIFGFGPIPALGVAGGAIALLLYYAGGTAVLVYYCASGRNAARLRSGPIHRAPLIDILAVGAPAALNAGLTNLIAGLSVALVGMHAGTQALAGFGTAARLEHLLMPIAFGLGAPMVAMIGANLGAGRPERARRIALTGGAIAFAIGETIGLVVASFPQTVLQWFGAEETMLAAGSGYLRIVGPFAGFFAMGFSLYFASQGARRLAWPLAAAITRLAIAVGIGAWVLASGLPLTAFYAVLALAMTTYGLMVLMSVWRTWSTTASIKPAASALAASVLPATPPLVSADPASSDPVSASGR